MQSLPARDFQLLFFPKVGWVRKLLTVLTKYIYLSKSNGPESSYNKLSGHFWLLRNVVTQPSYIKKRTYLICLLELNKPGQEKNPSVRKDTSPHIFTLESLVLLSDPRQVLLSGFLPPHTLLALCLSPQAHSSALQTLLVSCPVMQLNRRYQCLFTTSISPLMFPLPWWAATEPEI